MPEDLGEDFVYEPGGFEPFDRFAIGSADADADDDDVADAFDPFMVNL